MSPQGHHWQKQPSWRILDTQFGAGDIFLDTWHTWREDADRPRLLHYVALCEQPSSATELTKYFANHPELAPLGVQLSRHWFGLMPGFHRFLLEQGQVVLTLCIGEPLSMLRAQQFEADAIELALPDIGKNVQPWFLKALTQCCRRGTRLVVRHWATDYGNELSNALSQCGFKINPEVPGIGLFDPAWQLKKTRPTTLTLPLPIQRCAVIGAGLAGASVAASLVRRGWQVTVLDQAEAPAAGASGLPVGLVVPHVSSDDCTLSRLSRAGVRLMLQQVGELLKENQDWAPSGVFERQIGGTPKLPSNWPAAGGQWSMQGHPEGHLDLGCGLWHPKGAWIKPAALVNAWLNQPGVTFQGNARVADVCRQGNTWVLSDAQGELLCEAECVVFSNASGAFDLLQKMKHPALDTQGSEPHLPSKQGMLGLLSWALHAESEKTGFTPFPVNGSGSIVTGIPTENGQAWFMGSSYQPESQPERSDQENHLRNLDHLEQLLPPVAQNLNEAFQTGALQAWKGTRCIVADRLPVVGPLDATDQPGWWICAGLGSRGLSFSVLCAELLAARMGAEPWPVEAKLARSLEALRA
ncbi:MAG: FAD dependent oxidoreductase [Comamonadaceae bacterium]|nr:MAG: FAD dependent oxidoreductase [Comamonadaceae bacterium]